MPYPTYLPYPTVAKRYLPVIRKCPRRFCCQHDSVASLQNGCSLPLLTTWIRLAGTPSVTR